MNSYLFYVNIKQGTQSDPRFSAGNTLPLTQRPWAMTAFCPQNRNGGSGWFYHPQQHSLEGVRLTHQPSPWIGDYGPVLMTPQNDILSDNAGGAWSGFRPKEAVLTPEYLKVRFLRSGCTFELTPTQRCAAVRLSFDSDRLSFLTLLPVKGVYGYRFDAAANRVYGYAEGHSGDAAKDFRMSFVLQFPAGTVDWERCSVRNDNPSDRAAAFIALNGRTAEFQIATSYLGEVQALRNLRTECAGRSFDDIRAEGAGIWEELLHRIEIEADSEEQMRTFYSCLYRACLFPHRAYELDEDGNPIHYSPFDGKEHPGVRYTDNGFWDTYRTVYPLYAFIARDEYAEMIDGFICDYREGGWLPRWPSIGEVGCMPSTLIDAVLADAAVKGIGSPALWQDALDGMLNHANNAAPEKRYGRNGCLSYLKLGYVPRDEERESVNLTQDAAYGDFCIAQVAKVLGYEDLYDEYMRRSKNYRNIFDPVSGFMRGRDTEGEMAEFFDPIVWGGEYTEGSAWQNSFAVPHDIEGLAELHGGREALLAKLDELFATPPAYRVHGYNGEIHEMTEMAAVDFGQCAISNQPSFHLPYLYAALGCRSKTEYWVQKICSELFSAADDGFPGDEDNGTMAAWYIFSCLGFYPLCPGKNELIPSKMLVRSAKILGVDAAEAAAPYLKK